MKTQPIQLQFYTKSDCPLCDKAKEILRQVGDRVDIQVEEIDITANLGLFTRYKNLIPVLEMEGKRLFVHRIHPQKLRRQLLWRQCQVWLTRLLQRQNKSNSQANGQN